MPATGTADVIAALLMVADGAIGTFGTKWGGLGGRLLGARDRERESGGTGVRSPGTDETIIDLGEARE